MKNNLAAYSLELQSDELLIQSHGALATMLNEHIKIHQGKAWLYADVTSLSAGATRTLLLKVDSITHMRQLWFQMDTAPAIIKFYSGSVVSSTGALLPAKPANQSLVNTPGMNLYDAPVVTTTGSLLATHLLNGIKQEGGLSQNPYQEWILCPGSSYLATIQSLSPSNAMLELDTFWYGK